VRSQADRWTHGRRDFALFIATGNQVFVPVACRVRRTFVPTLSKCRDLVRAGQSVIAG